MGFLFTFFLLILVIKKTASLEAWDACIPFEGLFSVLLKMDAISS